MASKLMSMHFFTSDPTQQGSLHLGPWSTSDLRELSNEYLWKNKIYCMVPGCGTPHMHGFTGVLSDSSIVLIGHCCARKKLELDQSFSLLRKTLQEKSRYHALMNRLPLSPETLLACFQAWGPTAQQVTKIHNELRRNCSAFDAIATACRRENGNLRRAVFQTNYASLETRSSKELTSDDEFSQRSTRFELVHQVTARIFFGLGHRTIEYFRKAEAEAREAIALIARGHLKASEVSRISKTWTTATENAEQAFALIQDYARALNSGDLPGVAKWLRECNDVDVRLTTEGETGNPCLKFRSGLPIVLPRLEVPDFKPLGWRGATDAQSLVA